jgi:aspartate carbamoyltransferase catalytic subunit
VEKASCESAVPVINAGDGLEHPTQALKDLFTIDEELGQIDGLHIVVAGDLQGRAVRSLLYALCCYRDMRVTPVSLRELRLPANVKEYAENRGVRINREEKLITAMRTADVVYITRPQIENWFPGLGQQTSQELIRLRSEKYFRVCGINAEIMSNLPAHARVLHPLPHNDELATDLDPSSDQRLAYFRQEDNGGPLGIALLARLHLGQSWRMGIQKLS